MNTNTSWLYKVNSGEFDQHGEPVQYWFIYTLGTLITSMHLATNEYHWEEDGKPSSIASGILLEKVMPIEHEEEFLASEYSSWVSLCQFWADKN